jgi:hypothetical protein
MASIGLSASKMSRVSEFDTFDTFATLAGHPVESSSQRAEGDHHSGQTVTVHLPCDPPSRFRGPLCRSCRAAAAPDLRPAVYPASRTITGARTSRLGHPERHRKPIGQRAHGEIWTAYWSEQGDQRSANYRSPSRSGSPSLILWPALWDGLSLRCR